MFKVPEQYRITNGPMASPANAGNFGGFIVPQNDIQFIVIASDGRGWEHVSVHAHLTKLNSKRTPIWGEMCFIKSLFWDEEDTVIQYHPPKSQYVNCHPFVLHLWRPIGISIPLPPSILVGPK